MSIAVIFKKVATNPVNIAQAYGLLLWGFITAGLLALMGRSATFSPGLFSIVSLATLMAMAATLIIRTTSWSGFSAFTVFSAGVGYIVGVLMDLTLPLTPGHALMFHSLMATLVVTLLMTGYALHSGLSFNNLTRILFVGLNIVCACLAVNLLFQSGAFAIAIACVSIMVLGGYLLYDSGKLVTAEVQAPMVNATMLFLNMMAMFYSIATLGAHIT